MRWHSKQPGFQIFLEAPPETWLFSFHKLAILRRWGDWGGPTSRSLEPQVYRSQDVQLQLGFADPSSVAKKLLRHIVQRRLGQPLLLKAGQIGSAVAGMD